MSSSPFFGFSSSISPEREVSFIIETIDDKESSYPYIFSLFSTRFEESSCSCLLLSYSLMEPIEMPSDIVYPLWGSSPSDSLQ